MSLKDTTNYMAEHNTVCLQIKAGRNCFQGNLAEILPGRETTGIKTNNTQDIDATPANGVHGPCLVYTDFENGFVDSFPILTTGGLGTEVSHLAIGSFPVDAHISQNGKLVYVDSLVTLGPPSLLSSYKLGAGCVLTPLSSFTATSNFYVSLALLNPTRLLTADVDTGSLDTYALTPSGGISLLNSVPGQFTTFPSQVASLRTRNGQHEVFTGRFGLPQAQGGLESLATGAITFLNGSPVSDPSGSNAASIYADEDRLLAGREFQQLAGRFQDHAGSSRPHRLPAAYTSFANRRTGAGGLCPHGQYALCRRRFQWRRGVLFDHE